MVKIHKSEKNLTNLLTRVGWGKKNWGVLIFQFREGGNSQFRALGTKGNQESPQRQFAQTSLLIKAKERNNHQIFKSLTLL